MNQLLRKPTIHEPIVPRRGRILQFFVEQKILKFGMIQQLNRKDHYDGNEPWLLVQVDP